MAKESRSYLSFGTPPQVSDPDALRVTKWLESVLNILVRRLNEPSELRLNVTYVAPVKPRAGMLAYADGTQWDPGSGEGLYRYTLAGSWTKVG